MNITHHPGLSVVWDEVLDKFGFPNMRPPQLISMPNQTAHINLQTLDIKVGEEFIKSLNMPFEDAFKAVSAHEVGHHITFPYDLTTCYKVISVMAEAGSQTPKRDENLFGDIIVNLDLVRRGIPEIARVYHDFDDDGELFTAIKAVQSLQSGVDFGHARKVSKKTHSLISELNSLSYSYETKEEMLSNAWDFAKIIQDCDVTYEGNDLGNVFEDNSGEVSGKDIIEASKKLGFDEASRLKDIPGLESIVDDILIQKYKRWSQKYSVLPNKKNMYMSGSENTEINDFEIGHQVRDVDVYKSFGKFLPGFSKVKKVARYENEGERNNFDLPNAVIAIDTSGSMQDPREIKSFAAIAAFAIARTYAAHSRKVATYNFSSYVVETGFDADISEAYKNFLNFQFDGSDIDIGRLDVLLEKDADADLYVLSDMCLVDEGNVNAYLDKIGKDRRVSIFEILGSNLFNYDNVAVYKISSMQDLPGRVFKDVRGKMR